jgi:hypothetical protein
MDHVEDELDLQLALVLRQQYTRALQVSFCKVSSSLPAHCIVQHVCAVK